jgi:hypothetical protein
VLDLEATKNRIKEWQNNPANHPLTCLYDSSHKPVVPVIYWADDEEKMWPFPHPIICLVCPDCGCVQGWIPEQFRVEVK